MFAAQERSVNTSSVRSRNFRENTNWNSSNHRKSLNISKRILKVF